MTPTLVAHFLPGVYFFAWEPCPARTEGSPLASTPSLHLDCSSPPVVGVDFLLCISSLNERGVEPRWRLSSSWRSRPPFGSPITHSLSEIPFPSHAGLTPHEPSSSGLVSQMIRTIPDGTPPALQACTSSSLPS